VRHVAFLLVAGLLSGPVAAQGASCRYYGREIQSAIKQHVQALRAVELETIDRIAGLDTRPYEFLVAQARNAAGIIADQKGLADEDALRRCRNYVRPVRHICAAAATMLVKLIEEQIAGATLVSTRRSYSDSMPHCERSMGFTELRTAFRSVD